LNEPFSAVLRMPWDQVLLSLADAQEIERDEGVGALIQLFKRRE